MDRKLYRVWIYRVLVALDWATKDEAETFVEQYEKENPGVSPIEIVPLYSVNQDSPEYIKYKSLNSY